MADREFPSRSDLIADPGTLGRESSTDQDAGRRALAVVEAIREDFKDRDQQLEDLEKVIYLENAVSIPQGYQKTALEVRSPLASHIVNTITSALSVNPPAVTFDPVGIGDAAKENQVLREHYFDASWLRQEEEAKRPLFRLLTHSVVGFGEGTLKTLERKKRVWNAYGAYAKKLRSDLDKDEYLDDSSKDRIFDAKTEEYKRGQAYPIATTDVPPGSFYYRKNEDGFTTVCEVKELPYLDAIERFSVGVDKLGNVVPEAMGLPIEDCRKALGDQKTLRVVEVWTWDKVVYVVQGARQIEKQDGMVVKILKHGYGDKTLRTLRGPYFHSLGVTTSSRDIYKQSQSVLFAFLRLFPLLDRLLTIRGQSAFAYGFGAFRRKQPPALGLPDSGFGTDAAEAESQDEQIRPGYVYPYDIEPINQPSGGVDLDKAIADVRSMIELALPSAAQGVIQGESGYAINQAAHLARLAWNPIIANLEQMLSERVGFESWLIEQKIQEKVYVYGTLPDEIVGTRRRRSPDQGWLGIDPDDLDGLHRYRVKLKPETPSNQVIEIRMHADMLKMGVESQAMAIEALGNNAIEVKRELMLEQLQADPAIQQQIKQRVFTRLATIQQQAMQGADAMPPAGAPSPDAQGQQMAPNPAMLAALAAGGGAGPGGVPPPAAGPPVPQPGIPGQPGTPAGMGPIRNYPQGHEPLPGQ